MKPKLFFPIICTPVEQEIAEFDPDTIQVAGEPLKPDDVRIGELNEFEQKCFRWLAYADLTYSADNTPQQLVDELMEDERLFAQFMDEQEILLVRIQTAIRLFHVSVFGRINGLLEGHTVTDHNGLAVREGKILVITADREAEALRIEENLERDLSSPAFHQEGPPN